MKKFSIGLIGFGIWGKKILEELIFLQAKVHVFEVGLKGRTEALSKGASSFETNFDSFMSCELDAIIIASSTSSHSDLLKLLTSSQLPIFVEKPLTNNSSDLSEIQQLDLQSVFVMHIWKYHSGVRLLGRLAREGRVGEIKGVKSIRANWTSPRTDTNSLWNLAIHDLSICETILGDIPKRKQAVGERHSGELRGVVALMGSEPYYHFEVSNRYPEKLREIRVFGTEGVMVLTDEKVDYISIYNGDDGSELLLDSMEKIHFDSTPPLRVELQVFLDFLNGGVPPETDLEEGIRLIQHLIEIEKLV